MRASALGALDNQLSPACTVCLRTYICSISTYRQIPLTSPLHPLIHPFPCLIHGDLLNRLLGEVCTGTTLTMLFSSLIPLLGALTALNLVSALPFSSPSPLPRSVTATLSPHASTPIKNAPPAGSGTLIDPETGRPPVSSFIQDDDRMSPRKSTIQLRTETIHSFDPLSNGRPILITREWDEEGQCTEYIDDPVYPDDVDYDDNDDAEADGDYIDPNADGGFGGNLSARDSADTNASVAERRSRGECELGEWKCEAGGLEMCHHERDDERLGTYRHHTAVYFTAHALHAYARARAWALVVPPTRHPASYLTLGSVESIRISGLADPISMGEITRVPDELPDRQRDPVPLVLANSGR